MGAEPLDDPPLRALDRVDLEADAGHVVEGIAQQVVGLEPDRERLEQPLAAADEAHRAADVLEQQQPPAGAQDAQGLGRGSPRASAAAPGGASTAPR